MFGAWPALLRLLCCNTTVYQLMSEILLVTPIKEFSYLVVYGLRSDGTLKGLFRGYRRASICGFSVPLYNRSGS
jgi:hypothetical protein